MKITQLNEAFWNIDNLVNRLYNEFFKKGDDVVYRFFRNQITIDTIQDHWREIFPTKFLDAHDLAKYADGDDEIISILEDNDDVEVYINYRNGNIVTSHGLLRRNRVKLNKRLKKYLKKNAFPSMDAFLSLHNSADINTKEVNLSCDGFGMLEFYSMVVSMNPDELYHATFDQLMQVITKSRFLFPNEIKRFKEIAKEYRRDQTKLVIKHELTHLFDELKYGDAAGITSVTTKLKGKGKKGGNEYSNDHEFNAIMNQIHQVYQDTDEEEWNSMTLNDLFERYIFLEQLQLVYSGGGMSILKQFIRRTIQRLHREGILGDNMKSVDYKSLEEKITGL